MIQIKDTCYKGTRILIGDNKRNVINKLIDTAISNGYEEIQMPIIQHAEYFEDKVGQENNNMMYNFTDRGNRNLCLAPEYTAIIQALSNGIFKYEKDMKLFYVQECFRGEKPQAGRYRQFTQFGIEIINPTRDYSNELVKLARSLIMRSITPLGKKYNEDVFLNDLKINTDATRGLDYYLGGKGFEIAYEKLGAQKQICGGGEYEGGVGFALGVDRLLEMINIINTDQL